MIDLNHIKAVAPPPDGLLPNFWKTYKESLLLEGELTSQLRELKMQLDRTSGIRQAIERLLFALEDSHS